MKAALPFFSGLGLTLLALPLRADIAETFDAGWSDASYSNISTWDHSGVGIWESNDAVVATQNARTGSSVRLNKSSAAYLEFKGSDGQGVDGGIGTVSFWVRHWNGDGTEITFAIEVNASNTGWAEVATGSTSSTNYEECRRSLNLTGDDLRIRIRPTSAPERLVIDDFSLTTEGGEPEPDLPEIAFASPTSTFLESGGAMRIPVTLSEAATASAQIQIVGGSASTPDDFVLRSTTVTFDSDTTTQWVELEVTNDDLAEGPETIDLRLTAASGATVSTTGHTVTLLDDDSASSNTGETLVIASANITSGNYQEYEAAGDRILQAIGADVIGIQELNVPDSGGVRDWVDRVFGADFHYMIEPGSDSIPCGVISRYPITASGEWDDPQVSDRDFAWATIDIPGEKDLHVISVHLHGSGGTGSRNTEAGVLVERTRASFPADDYIVLCGDFNTTTRTESAVTTLKQIFSDDHVPVGRDGNDNTNLNRNKPYDWVMPNAALEVLHQAYTIGGITFPDGCVFDTREWSPTPSPAQIGDSGVSMMQHMAVVKAYQLPSETENSRTSHGTPQSWLELHQLGPDFESSDLLDSDGDGQLNWQEYQANTDPLDPQSHFSILSVQAAQGGVSVTCSTRPGRAYTIEFSDDQLTEWTPFLQSSLATFVETSAVSATHTFVDDFSGTTSGAAPISGRRFYRVGVAIP
ncbi:endonuclease/exonuclease/phosphatase family metal-dependent hydrolase [Haloferula luteola]|uniref:Endonuclease/exonuclease/phosphatase family metal-dependent hydrolase n=1 Tax=Haloferula luteola TaxID=595692 RepID=A0A840V0Q7_9BACT|nr:endonuclease/exonuclease/phosphatase family protein [Haloferula luteola]MBB5351575.1 endonuclease/exonuclease/phosphatase family metal-dependent hydrolase [Haloferula luteola]